MFKSLYFLVLQNMGEVLVTDPPLPMTNRKIGDGTGVLLPATVPFIQDTTVLSNNNNTIILFNTFFASVFSCRLFTLKKPY